MSQQLDRNDFRLNTGDHSIHKLNFNISRLEIGGFELESTSTYNSDEKLQAITMDVLFHKRYFVYKLAFENPISSLRVRIPFNAIEAIACNCNQVQLQVNCQPEIFIKAKLVKGEPSTNLTDASNPAQVVCTELSQYPLHKICMIESDVNTLRSYLFYFDEGFFKKLSKPILEPVPPRPLPINLMTSDENINSSVTKVDDMPNEIVVVVFNAKEDEVEPNTFESPFDDPNATIIYPRFKSNDTIIMVPPSNAENTSLVYFKDYIYINEEEPKDCLCRPGSRLCASLTPEERMSYNKNRATTNSSSHSPEHVDEFQANQDRSVSSPEAVDILEPFVQGLPQKVLRKKASQAQKNFETTTLPSPQETEALEKPSTVNRESLPHILESHTDNLQIDLNPLDTSVSDVSSKSLNILDGSKDSTLSPLCTTLPSVSNNSSYPWSTSEANLVNVPSTSSLKSTTNLNQGNASNDQVVFTTDKTNQNEPSSTSNVNDVTASHNYCSCRLNCVSKRCACSGELKGCNPSCSCKNCNNPLNVFQAYSVNIEEALKDTCLKENICKMKNLMDFMDRIVRVGCCEAEIRFLDCIPGVKDCPSCKAQLQYSWCKGIVCVESIYPRKHCQVCKKCAIIERNLNCMCKTNKASVSSVDKSTEN